MFTNSESAFDPRLQAERRRLEQQERRNQAICDQRALDRTPDSRVRVWERLHQLSLPRDPAHAILGKVAAATGLSIADVQEVQRLRVAAAG